MAKPHGSVRIGPISLFTLIIVLCLAVLAVLSVTTARAELSITERQAATTTETYQLEDVGQHFLANVDAALAQGDAAVNQVLAGYGISMAEPAEDGNDGLVIEDDSLSGEAVSDAGGTTMTATDGSSVSSTGERDGNTISVTFSVESGRTLAVTLRINDDGTYTIEQWKTTTQWTDDGTGETLWLG